MLCGYTIACAVASPCPASRTCSAIQRSKGSDMSMNERIKKIRIDHKLTQEEFASYLNISKSSVSLLESGRNRPSKQTTAFLCEKFSVSLKWLKTGEGEPYINRSSSSNLSDRIRDLTRGEHPLMAAVLVSLSAMPPQWWETWAEELYEEANRVNKTKKDF